MRLTDEDRRDALRQLLVARMSIEAGEDILAAVQVNALRSFLRARLPIPIPTMDDEEDPYDGAFPQVKPR